MKWFDAGTKIMSVSTFGSFIKIMKLQCTASWVSLRDRDEAEAELVEEGTIECVNTEITQELSSMSEIGHNGNAQVPNASEGPKVFFANADDLTHQESAPVDQPDD